MSQPSTSLAFIAIKFSIFFYPNPEKSFSARSILRSSGSISSSVLFLKPEPISSTIGIDHIRIFLYRSALITVQCTLNIVQTWRGQMFLSQILPSKPLVEISSFSVHSNTYQLPGQNSFRNLLNTMYQFTDMNGSPNEVTPPTYFSPV